MLPTLALRQIRTILALLVPSMTSLTGSALAQAQPAEALSSTSIADGFARLQQHSQAIIEAVPSMPRYLADVAGAFGHAAGTAGVGRILLNAVLCLIAG